MSEPWVTCVDRAMSFQPPHSAKIAGCEQGICGLQRISVRVRLELVCLHLLGRLSSVKSAALALAFQARSEHLGVDLSHPSALPLLSKG